MSFLISLVLTVILTPLVIRYRIVDKPNYRSIHTQETPKAGGIAILIGVLGGLFWSGQGTSYLPLALLMVGATSLGLLDDLKNLSPRGKMLGQLALASLTIGLGYNFYLFGNVLDQIISLLWIIGFMNAFNLIDGMDGLASGVAGIAALIFLASGIGILTELTPPLLGALAGFLFFNFRPAKIFMGDTGSMFLGYFLALLGMIMQKESTLSWVGAIATLLILLYPIFDLFLSIIRRKINNKPIFAPDRSHSYNLLMDQVGLSYLGSVFTVYGIGAFWGLLGLVAFLRQSYLLAALSLVLALGIMIFFTLRYDLLKESKYEKSPRQ